MSDVVYVTPVDASVFGDSRVATEARKELVVVLPVKGAVAVVS